jgi:hypothetical protein
MNRLVISQRFSAGLLAVTIACAAAIGLQYSGAQAAGSYTLKGRVYNVADGTGLANAKLNLCYGHTVVTDGAGNWSFGGLSQKSLYCVRYLSGVSGGISRTLAVNSRTDQGSRQTYEYQSAGYSCYQDKSCATAEQHYDLASDEGLDLAMTLSPVATPAPTPVPDVTAPSVPSVLQALAADDNAVVSLTWDASNDVSGIKAYQIDRSIDQVTWVNLSTTTTEAKYRDDTAAFGTHYYYRVRATDGLNWSDYGFVDTRTPEFKSNTAETDTSFQSDDKLATVVLPGGALSVLANCRLTTEERKLRLETGKTLIAGSYVFMCKTTGGEVVTDLARPLAWSFNLKGKMDGLQSPSVIVSGYDGKNPQALSDPATYDQKQLVLQVATSQLGTMAVVASASSKAKSGIVVISVIVVFVLVVGVGGGLYLMKTRRRQVGTDRDELRSKYYDI